MNESTFASVTLQVVPQPVQAIIKGEPEVTVGSRSGTILLDGSESGGFGVPVVYQWSCHDKNNEPCYNMMETSQNNILVSREEQSKSVLKLLSSQLESGKKLKFSLQVFSARNPSVKSNTSLTLNVVEGDMPQVWLQSVSVQGVPIRRRNPITGVFTVPARMPVIIEATVNSMKRAVQTLNWNITGFPHPYHYNDLKGSRKGETILSLAQGTIVEHGVYVIDLEACNNDGACGTANLTLYAFPVVALCHVYVEPYVAYGWTQAVVLTCSVPTERTPLTYQLYMQSLEKLIPVTSLQFSYIFRFIGLPPPANSSTVFYTAKVCDRFGVCLWFRSNPVQVTLPANGTQSANTLYILSKQAQETGSPLQALTFLSLAVSALNRNLTTEESQQAISYVTEIIAYQPITTGDASVILNSLSSLLSSGDQAVRLKAIAAVARTILKTKASEKNPSVTIIQEAFSLVTNAIELYQDDPKTLQKLGRVHHQLTKVAAALLTAGQKLELQTKDENLPKAALQYMMLDKDSGMIEVRGKQEDDTVEASAEFSTEVQNRFKRWKCETKKCQGVAISMRLYDKLNPLPEDPVFRRVAPIVIIELQTPETGKIIQLNSIPDLIILTITQTVNISEDSQVAPKCHFWSSSEKAWKTDGLKTFGFADGMVTCRSNHLSAFTVLEVPIGLSTAAVAGIVIGSLVAVLIVGVVAALLVRKKNAKLSKVDSEEISVGKADE
ncbi:uncharacterized protein LOC106474401 isoform X2 [Limulus polyphemus]|nr:uncharacterized protein LOC106474401 isoform X2 [Limulus polyphemus]